MAVAIPIAVGALELLELLGIGLTSIGAILAMKSNLPAKMQQWISDHTAQVEKDLQKKEPREPTPFTAPPLFDTITISNTKVWKKKGTEEIWASDTLHWDHFEVYDDTKSYEKRKRNRAVFVDGRLKCRF